MRNYELLVVTQADLEEAAPGGCKYKNRKLDHRSRWVKSKRPITGEKDDLLTKSTNNVKAFMFCLNSQCHRNLRLNWNADYVSWNP